MVETMAPAVIQETIKKTPKPGSAIPQVIEDLYEETGDGSKFRKIVAAGYMSYEKYLQSKNSKYKLLSYRNIAKKFQSRHQRLDGNLGRERLIRGKRQRQKEWLSMNTLDVKPVLQA